jgi:hypothetical protein
MASGRLSVIASVRLKFKFSQLSLKDQEEYQLQLERGALQQ